MLPALLARDEGRTLEFKLNGLGLRQIVQTVVAFANTAGGTLVLGVRDRTKEVVGLTDPLTDELRLANAFADSILPTLAPDLTIVSWRGRELIVVTVAHGAGPYYVAASGPEAGVFVRVGSSNRRADASTVAELRRLAVNRCFDELPYPEVDPEDIDFRALSGSLPPGAPAAGPALWRSLGLLIEHHGRQVPTVGAVLLYGKTRAEHFPDATVRCARFAGTTRTQLLDQTDVDLPLPLTVEAVIAFIARNTRVGARIGHVRREDLYDYAPLSVREAVINAVVHTDYSARGAGATVAIFDDRMEISNPGPLPFGLTLEAALAGFSRLRNRVIGRVLRRLGLIEQWGSGMARMLEACRARGDVAPRFEEQGTSFRVTLFPGSAPAARVDWLDALLALPGFTTGFSTTEAASAWRLSTRTARTRLRRLVARGLLTEVGTGPFDPHRRYVSRNG